MGETQENDTVAQVVEALYGGYTTGHRALVVVRCSSSAGVTAAIGAITAASVAFEWRPVLVAGLTPPDLLGFLMTASATEGPAVVAHGFPSDARGELPKELVSSAKEQLARYLEEPTLAVLVVTLKEMRLLNLALPDLWRARTALCAWPEEGAAGANLPARVAAGGLEKPREGPVARPVAGAVERPAAGPVEKPAAGPVEKPAAGPVEKPAAGPLGKPAPGPVEKPPAGPVTERPAGKVEAAKAAHRQLADPFAQALEAAAQTAPTEKETPWVGAPFTVDDPNIPGYYKTAAPPAGCRWGKHLAPGDPEGAQLIDRCRQLLAQRQYEEVLQLLAKAAKRFRSVGNWRACTECYVLLGKTAEMRLDWRLAQDWYGQALDLCHEIDDLAAYSDVSTILGYMAFVRGELRGASDFFGRAMLVDERLADEFRLAAAFHRLGIVAEQVGRYDDSLVLYQKAAKIEETHRDRAAYARSLNHQARVNRLIGELHQAADLLQKSLDIREELEDETGLATGYHELGNLRYTEKEMSAAFDAYRRALTLELAHHDVHGVAVTQAQLGLVHMSRMAYRDAAGALLIAREVFSRLGSPHAKVIAPALKEPQEMLDEFELATLEQAARTYADDLMAGKLAGKD